jgi:Spy/CpxP family protein refolding chaperone
MNRFNLAGFSVASTLALALAGVSFAQPPVGRGPEKFIEEHAETLGLDEETVTAIRGIVEESRDAGDQLHDELRKRHREMKELLAQNTPDEAAVMRLVETIGALETRMHKHRLSTMLKIRAHLTPEQREQLVATRGESRGRMRHAVLEACEANLQAVCPDADDRWDRRKCMHEHREELSTECRDAIETQREHHRGGEHGERRGDPSF